MTICIKEQRQYCHAVNHITVVIFANNTAQEHIWVILYFFAYKTECFSFQNNPKNLDPSYKTDLDFWDCLGRVKLVLQQNCIGLIWLYVLILKRGIPRLIAEYIGKCVTQWLKIAGVMRCLSYFMNSHHYTRKIDTEFAKVFQKTKYRFWNILFLNIDWIYSCKRCQLGNVILKRFFILTSKRHTIA